MSGPRVVVTLLPYTDHDDGFSLLVPREWEQVDPTADEVRLVAVEPLAGQGFRANVVVTVDGLPEGLSLGELQDGNDGLMQGERRTGVTAGLGGAAARVARV